MVVEVVAMLVVVIRVVVDVMMKIVVTRAVEVVKTKIVETANNVETAIKVAMDVEITDVFT